MKIVIKIQDKAEAQVTSSKFLATRNMSSNLTSPPGSGAGGTSHSKSLGKVDAIRKAFKSLPKLRKCVRNQLLVDGYVGHRLN